MDFSNEYVNMCNKSEEIKSEHKREIGDFIYRRDLSIRVAIDKKDFQDNNYTWLPRLDQLQELLEKDDISITYDDPAIIRLFERLDNKSKTHLVEYWHKFDTLEKLWLAIYMYDFFFKKWDESTKTWQK